MTVLLFNNCESPSRPLPPPTTNPERRRSKRERNRQIRSQIIWQFHTFANCCHFKPDNLILFYFSTHPPPRPPLTRPTTPLSTVGVFSLAQPSRALERQPWQATPPAKCLTFLKDSFKTRKGTCL